MIALQTKPELREPITSGTRSNLVDIVKGVAIILVTLGHTAQGMVHRGWWNTPSASFFRALIYSFHMPAFFFIAGLFVHGSIKRRGRLDFTAEKAKSILYPYLLFAVIYTALRPLTGRFQMSAEPFEWRELPRQNRRWRRKLVPLCSLLLLHAGSPHNHASRLAAVCHRRRDRRDASLWASVDQPGPARVLLSRRGHVGRNAHLSARVWFRDLPRFSASLCWRHSRPR